jgi:uncharacterized protein YciI
LINKGNVVIVGPVADPKGILGLAVVEAKDEDEVRSLETNDPTIKGCIGFRYEVYSMPQAIIRK